MSFIINNFIKKELSLDLLRTFLKSKGLPYSKKIADLIVQIEDEVNSTDNLISEEDVTQLLKNAAKYGNRRMFYITKIERSSLQKIKTKSAISKKISTISPYKNYNNFNDFNTDKNNLEKLINKNTYILEYLNTTYDELDLVDKIEMCYTYTYDTSKKAEDGTELKFTYKDYFWITINFKSAVMCIQLPSFPEYFGNAYTNNSLFNHFYKQIANDFGIIFSDMSDSNKVLYQVFKEIISVSEKPFKKRMEAHQDLIPKVSEMLSGNSVLQKPSYSIFEERLQDLIERLIIHENFKEYLEYSKGKDGIISQMQYTDETGASVNASSGSTKKKGTIELCDVFFDTRKTINDNEKVDILWIDWFLDFLIAENRENEELLDEPVEPVQVPKVTTKFISSEKYLLMHFRRILLEEEVVTHVLSKLRNYPEFRW